MTPRRAAATVLAVLTVTLTGACNGSEPGPAPDPSASQISAPPQTGVPQTPSRSITPTPTPEPSKTPTPTPSPADAAKETVTEYYALLDQLLQDPKKPLDDLIEVSRDPAYSEAVKRVNGYRNAGHRLKGDAQIVSIAVGTPKGDPGELKVGVDVCVDVSATDVVNKDGESVVAEDRPVEASDRLELQQEDGTWFVTRERTGGHQCA